MERYRATKNVVTGTVQNLASQNMPLLVKQVVQRPGFSILKKLLFFVKPDVHDNNISGKRPIPKR